MLAALGCSSAGWFPGSRKDRLCTPDELDGRLAHARATREGFDSGRHGLVSFSVAVVEGMVLVNLSDDPPALHEAASAAQRESIGVCFAIRRDSPWIPL